MSITDRLNIQKFPAQCVLYISTQQNFCLILKSKGLNLFQGTVSAISSDKEDNAQFTMVPFKAFWSSMKYIWMFLLQENVFELLETKTLKPWETIISTRYWSDKGFRGTFVNSALSSLHGGSLEIKLTVPLIFNQSITINLRSIPVLKVFNEKTC